MVKEAGEKEKSSYKTGKRNIVGVGTYQQCQMLRKR